MSGIIKKDGGHIAGKPAASSALAKRFGHVKPAGALPGSRSAPITERSEIRPRMVFSVDATASRESTWESARQITDRLFQEIPGGLDVALAVHGGSMMHTFTEFSGDVGKFRDAAASVNCVAGRTKICDIMERTLECIGVRLVTYIGDAFEESADKAYSLADKFRERGIKLVILNDAASPNARIVFEELAKRTGGAVLDFRAQQLQSMGDIFGAVAALAVGGRKLLESRKTQGAKLLLENLKGE